MAQALFISYRILCHMCENNNMRSPELQTVERESTAHSTAVSTEQGQAVGTAVQWPVY